VDRGRNLGIRYVVALLEGLIPFLPQLLELHADNLGRVVGLRGERSSCSVDLQPRSLDAGDQAALVDFLANALTDCRVEQQRAPFDHPALPLPSRAADLPATGAAGLGSCP
jgi:hypothetical protein